MIACSLTLAHPSDLLSIGNRCSRVCRPIVSCPTHEHHAGALDLSSRSKVVLILAWNDLHTLIALIHVAVVHLVDIFTVDEFLGIVRVRTVDMDGILRCHT